MENRVEKYEENLSETDRLLSSPQRQYSSPNEDGFENLSREYQNAWQNSPYSGGTYLMNLESSSDTMRNCDNPTAIALQQCRKKVTKPFTLFLRVVGWQELYSGDSVRAKIINYIHPACVFIIIFVGYIIQYAACFQRSGIIHEDTNGTSCKTYIISEYIIPDIFHSLAYIVSFLMLRNAQSEHLNMLIEKVFLFTTAQDTSGLEKHGRLIRTLAFLFITGLIWIVLSTAVCIVQIALTSNDISFSFLQTENKTGKIFLFLLLIISFIALDIIYVAVIINYCLQATLIIKYIEAIREKINQGVLTLNNVLKSTNDVTEILRILNEKTALALSLVLLNFLLMGITSSVVLLGGLTKGYIQKIMAFLNAIVWLLGSIVPFLMAARLSAVANRLTKVGHEIRAQPHFYRDTPESELDSFLLFMSSLSLKAKIFFIPIRLQTLMKILVIIFFVLLVLFQLGKIHVWL